MSSVQFLAITLSAILALPLSAVGQQVSGPTANLVGPTALKIVVVQGEGAVNQIRTKAATAPVVEVRDENDKPVAGAEVVFQLPPSGPGGVFYDWLRSQTVRTDAQGRAAATGYVPNDEEGRFNIRVTAIVGTRSADATISQTNSRTGSGAGVSRGGHKGLWVLLGLAAVGGIAGGVAASRGGSSAAAAVTNPITITPGPITVAGPR